jgi:antirestriction protein ArdC
VTESIGAQLEQGAAPWHKPWSGANMEGRVLLPVRHNSVAYRGVNVITLWMAALAKGYRAPIWMTFKQAIDLGGCVRKGEKGSLSVYADSVTRDETDEASGETIERDIYYMKGYAVFNVEQIDGLPPYCYPAPEPRLDPVPRIERADAFFAATKASIRHGGNQAYYAIVKDHIQMPPMEAFQDTESYYVTLAHEATHNAVTGIMPHGAGNRRLAV